MHKALQGSIKTSEKLAALTDFEFRMWAYGLVTADMVGRLVLKPKLFKVMAVPLVETATEGGIAKALDVLCSSKLIHRYEVAGRVYGVYHDHEDYNKAMKNLKHLKTEYPAPPRNLCSCVQFLKNEGGGPSTVATVDATVVATTDVPVPSPVHVLVPVQEEGCGEEEFGPMDQVEEHLWKLMKRQKIIGKPGTKRDYLRGWIAQKGGAKVEQILSEPRCVGKAVLSIQKWYFDGMAGEGFAG